VDASDTRQALLDAAERLFAERGLEGASLRAITGEAGANLAAVHYHFGSKDGLIQAVLARRLGPLNEERLRRLEACRQGGRPAELECVLRAFVAPIIEIAVGGEAGRAAFGRLMIRIQGEPALAKRVLKEAFEDTARRFVDALRETLPALSEEELTRRLHFAIGAMARIVIMAHAGGDLCFSVLDPTTVTEPLVAFLAGGFRAATGEEGR
jgi:AcrR family transcriptional regulator